MKVKRKVISVRLSFVRQKERKQEPGVGYFARRARNGFILIVSE